MTFPAAIAGFIAGAGAIAFAIQVWRHIRRRPGRVGGPLPDVPDAPSTAAPIAAPGINTPYSSLDPFAPPKRFADGTRVDGLPEGE